MNFIQLYLNKYNLQLKKEVKKIKKQAILLVISFIFAITLCGTVTAADSASDQDLQINGTVHEIFNGTLSTNDPTPIYVNETGAIPVENASITIKKMDGSVITTTTTDAKGYYSTNFNSGQSNFLVEMAYSTYKTYTENVTVDSTHNATVDHIFMPDIVILSSGSDKKYAINSLNNRRLLFVDMFDTSYQSNPMYNQIIRQIKFALTDMAMPGSGYGDWWYQDLLESPANQDAKIAYTFGYPVTPPNELHILGYNGTNNVNTVENTYMGSYLINVNNQENIQNMVSYIYYLLGETSTDPTEEGKGPSFGIADWGIYHPDYPGENHICSVPDVTPSQIKTWIEADPGYLQSTGSLKWADNEYANWTSTIREEVYETFEKWYNTSKPNIDGSFIVIDSYYPGGTVVDALIREYEKQSRAVFNLYQGGTTPPISQFLDELTTGKNGIGPLSREVSAINSLYSWSMNYNNIYNGGATSDFESMNIAAIQALQLLDPSSLTNPLGAQYEWTMSVVSPSMEGVFSPIAISYTDNDGIIHPIYSSIKKLVSISTGWAKLKELPNFDKKIAVILYDYPPGKDSIGASYLDVFQTVHDLLVKLQAAGYDVGDTIPTADQLYTMVANFGNKGIWAQPLLDQYVQQNLGSLNNNEQLINVNQYMKWFNQLPAALQESVTEKWGSAPGNIMVSDGELVIPGLMFGNVFLTVQPSRGWDAVTNYHDPYLPPTHQYIAFYNWIEKVLGANAMIHLGTHGTLEFLPGRTTGLQEDDWPFQLTNIPNINPYIVSNPGEGITAKDRADALIIDHMTPAMVQSGLYGDLYTLQSLLDQYNNAVKLGNNQVLPALIVDITAKADALGLPTPTQGQVFSDYMEVLHEKLDEISDSIIPLGLHTYGEVMPDDQLIQETFTIASSRTSIMDDMKSVLYPSLTLSYYDLQKDAQQYSDVCDDITNHVLDYITQLMNGTDPNDLGVTGALLTDLVFCNTTIANIRVSGDSEWDSLMNSLNGGYVAAGLGADPAYADVLPTGKNFYASDTNKMPTKAAYQTAKQIADQLLTTYYQEHGKFPETIGMVMWGTELLRTDAIAIGEFLYLMGVTPTWDSYGNINGTSLIPPNDLTITINGNQMQRPRVDVFTTAVTGTQSWINLLNSAVKLAAGATGETMGQNYIVKHVALNPSLDRVFGLPGLVLEGTGVSDLLPNTSKWESTQELASVYLSRMSNAWRSTDSGVGVSKNSNGVDIEKNTATFEYLLKNADIVTQNLDSTWRLLDSDDYYDWYGGLLMTSRQLGGNPDGLVTDMRNQNNIVTRSYQDEIELEIRSQILNPAYQNSLLNTASGWNEYVQNYQDLFAFSATTNAVSNNLWTQVSQNLLNIANSGLSKDYQGYAMESMLGWTIEAAKRDMWQPSSQMLKDLANTNIETTVKYGVTCCHHTCGNLVFNQWVIKMSSLSPSTLQQYADTMNGATSMGLEVEGNPSDSSSDSEDSSNQDQSSNANSPGETVSAATVDSSSSDSAGASATAHEITPVNSQQSSQGGMTLYAILGVLIILGLFGTGYYLKSK